MAQSDVHSTGDQEVMVRYLLGPATFFNGPRNISTVIHSLPLIQEGQLSVSCERMHTNTG